MLAHSEKLKSMPSLSLKSLGPSPQKTTLYDLAVTEGLVTEVLEVPEEGCLTLSKLSLIKVYLSRYIAELQSLKKQKGEEKGQPPRKLLELVSSDSLIYLFEWMVEHLKTALLMTGKSISS